MAKRFTDTQKWRKGLLKGLSIEYKLLWLYLCDECSHAGVWDVELDVASLRLGFEYSLNETIEAFGKKILVFDNGEKWFIPSFIEFQYNILNGDNRVHKSVIDELTRFKLFKNNKVLIRPLQGCKDKDKDKDKDKAKEQEWKNQFEIWWNKYNKKRGRDKVESKWLTLKEEEMQLCLDSVDAYVRSTPEKQFRKDPATYLNQKCWGDEIYIDTDPKATCFKCEACGKPWVSGMTECSCGGKFVRG